MGERWSSPALSMTSFAVMIPNSLLMQVGIEPVIHYCCRDRNLLGMLSDLLGAQALGLRNLLLITGDPPKMGPYPDATAVFDIDAIGLTNLVANLNRGLDPGGNAIGEPTRFVIGVGVNPAAIDPAHELRRFEYKVEAGAEYAITQPVFDVRQLETFLGRIEHMNLPIVAGIFGATGQSCVAGSRLLVHESLHEPLLKRLAERAPQIRIGAAHPAPRIAWIWPFMSAAHWTGSEQTEPPSKQLISFAGFSQILSRPE